MIRDRITSVYIGGTLINAFDLDDDRGPRNVLAVTLAKTEQFHLGRLASALGITDEHLRRLRRKEETGGIGAVLGLRRGKVTKVTPELRTAWYAMFSAGRMPIDAYREQPRNQRLVYNTVWRVWDEWRRERDATRPSASTPPPETGPAATDDQLALALTGQDRDDELGHDAVTADGHDEAIASPREATPAATGDQLALVLAAEDRESDLGADPMTPDEDAEDIGPMTAQPVRGGKLVQHVGCWILLALAGELGLHEEAQRAFESRHPVDTPSGLAGFESPSAVESNGASPTGAGRRRVRGARTAMPAAFR